MDEDKEEKHEEVEVIEKGHSRFIGVSWNKPSNKWKAQSKVQGKQVHIWHYDIEEDTARAYQDYVEQVPFRHAQFQPLRSELSPGGRV